ncbi:efflux transporter outer membrane subunit [Labilithrix luteola]|uniref:efflux transporter outer membrane subunit n=1 Tax=Labilithrix luteola TaxID=1391654 RepID=UPI0014750699|nr:efflux transporter outer membrane subunit [Labilithrix luteola]
MLAAAVVTGCAVGPNYERPKLTAPSSYRFQTGTTAESLADLPWWKVFQDDPLHALVNDALKSNFDLIVASARVDESRALARAAGAQLLPSVSAASTGNYGNSLSGLGATPQPFWAVNATGNVSWEIDVFGRIRRNREVARAQYAASEEERRGVWVTVLADVAQNYFQLLALDLQRSIADRTVTSRAELLDLFRVRAEGGVGTDLDVARAEADLYGAKDTLANAEQQIALTENTIALLMGRTPGPIARSPTGDTLAEPPEVPAGLPSALLERRPDVRQAEANLVAANAQVGVATANLFPTVSLTALGGIVSNDLALVSQGGTNTSGVYSVGGSVNWLAPVLQGSQLRDQLDAQKKEWLAVRTTYIETVTRAFKDVADALVSLEKLRERRAATAKQVAALSRALEVSRIQFDGGTATYLDVINAQEQLFPNELSLAQLEGQQLVAYVQLYRTLGGGWWLTQR